VNVIPFPGLASEVRTATVSPGGGYRYQLTRRWEQHGPDALWIMLNPSTADGAVDDPTIRRCRTFSKREGCAGMVIVNLFAARATDPGALTHTRDPDGPENDRYLRAHLDPGHSSVTVAIAAWGSHPLTGPAGRDVVSRADALGRELWCLGTTKDGSPRHPLYVRADQPLVPFGGAS
jgi:hypothetical protein